MNAPTTRKRHLRNHVMTGRAVMTGLWADALLVMASSAYNGGAAFVALHQPQGQGIALGVAVDVALAVALVGDRALHLESRFSNWGRAIRVITAGMSLALNCAVPLWQGHPGVGAFHAFLPVLLVLLAEYAQDVTLQFGEIAAEYEAAEAKPEPAATDSDHGPNLPTSPPQTVAAPFRFAPPPTGPAVAPVRSDPAPGDRSAPIPADRSEPAVRTVQADRSAPATPERSARTSPDRSMNRPAERSASARADRSGPSSRTGRNRRQPGKPRTDADLSKAVRELAEQNGEAPSTYQLKQRFGIGSERAARLLDQLSTTTPAGPPASNGAARREGTR